MPPEVPPVSPVEQSETQVRLAGLQRSIEQGTTAAQRALTMFSSDLMKTVANFLGQDSKLGRILLRMADRPEPRLRFIKELVKIQETTPPVDSVPMITALGAQARAVLTAWNGRNNPERAAYSFEDHLRAVVASMNLTAAQRTTGISLQSIVDAGAVILATERTQASASPSATPTQAPNTVSSPPRFNIAGLAVNGSLNLTSALTEIPAFPNGTVKISQTEIQVQQGTNTLRFGFRLPAGAPTAVSLADVAGVTSVQQLMLRMQGGEATLDQIVTRIRSVAPGTNSIMVNGLTLERILS